MKYLTFFAVFTFAFLAFACDVKAGGQCFVQQGFVQQGFVQPQQRFVQQRFAQPQFAQQQRFVQRQNFFPQQSFRQRQVVVQRPFVQRQRFISRGNGGVGLLRSASLLGAFGNDAQRFSAIGVGLGFGF